MTPETRAVYEKWWDQTVENINDLPIDAYATGLQRGLEMAAAKVKKECPVYPLNESLAAHILQLAAREREAGNGSLLEG